MIYKKLENQKYIENCGDILASKSYHILFPEGRKSLCNSGIKEVDGKQWEVFWVHAETENAYYGSPAEGIGLCNVMILKEDTRDFLPEEIDKLNKMTYTLESGFSGEIVQAQKITVNPIKSKWK